MKALSTASASISSAAASAARRKRWRRRWPGEKRSWRCGGLMALKLKAF